MIFRHIENVLQSTRSRSVYLNGQPHQQFKIDCGITSNAHTKQQFGKKKKSERHIYTHTRNQSMAGVLNITRWWQNIHYVSIIVCVYFGFWCAVNDEDEQMNEWMNERDSNQVFLLFCLSFTLPAFLRLNSIDREIG